MSISIRHYKMFFKLNSLLGTALIHVADRGSTYHCNKWQWGYVELCYQRMCSRIRIKAKMLVWTRRIGRVSRFGLVTCKMKHRNSYAPLLNTETVAVFCITSNQPTISFSIKIVNKFKILDLPDQSYWTLSAVKLYFIRQCQFCISGETENGSVL